MKMSELHADLLRANQHVDLLEQPKEPVATLRDQFAMATITGLIMRNGGLLPEITAEEAYKMADAMLKAREAK